MINHGVIKQSALDGVLKRTSAIAQSKSKGEKSIVAELLLTALIDAFSILVIFLLMSFSSNAEILNNDKNIELPQATSLASLDPQPIIKFDRNRIYLNEKEVPLAQMVTELLQVRTDWISAHPGQEFPATLIVQGDRRLKYESLSGIVQAASQAGFSDLKFAALAR